MAYLGTKPQSGFISQEANQYFTGLTQNFIDLNQSISSLSSVIVLVNGVVQENSDLTLTSSTRITLGATLVSGDKVTCIYVAKISSTQAPATGSVTSDMLSGSIANSKLANSSVSINGSTLALGGSLTGIGEDNTPYFLTTGNGSQSVANGTMVTVAYNTLVDSLDSASGFNTSNYRYYVQSGGAGFWLFTSAVYFTGIADGTQFDINFYKNSGNKSQSRQKSGGSMNATIQVTQLIKMAVGDYAEIKVFQNTGSTQGVNVNDASSFFGGFRIKEL